MSLDARADREIGSWAKFVTLSVFAFYLLGDVAQKVVSAQILVGYLFLAVGGVVMLVRGGKQRSRAREWAAMTCFLIAAGCAFISGESNFWLPQISFIMLAFLIIHSGRLFVVVSLGLGGMVLASWVIVVTPTQEDVQRTVIIPVCIIACALVWRWLLDQMARKEVELDSEFARAELERRIASAASERTSAEIQEIRSAVAPLLTHLRSGGFVGEEERRQAAMLEAAIRDRIRVPRLQHPLLLRAIEQARERGVAVALIGDPADGRPSISEALAVSIADQLESVAGGGVTIRLLPERYRADVAVVLNEPDRLRKYSFDQHGNCVAETHAAKV